jgi:hypothetical protein
LRPPSLIAPSPFSNSVSSSIVTSPPVLTRSRLLDLLILEILSVPLVLNGRRGAIVDPFVKMLPFDDILQTILRHCQDSGNEKWNLEPDVVAGLLINLTALGTRDSGVHLKQSLVRWCVRNQFPSSDVCLLIRSHTAMSSSYSYPTFYLLTCQMTGKSKGPLIWC